MDQKYYNISYAESPFGTLNQYMTRTYSWMAAGLLVTFATALLTVTTPLFELMFSTGLVFLLSIAELVLVAVLSARVERLQPTTATGLFFAYAVLNGINLSTYFIIYDLSTLILAFLVGTVYFGVMAERLGYQPDGCFDCHYFDQPGGRPDRHADRRGLWYDGYRALRGFGPGVYAVHGL